jgi:hypothetical protein
MKNEKRFAVTFRTWSSNFAETKTVWASTSEEAKAKATEGQMVDQSLGVKVVQCK